jgi:hypothetical protein
MGDHDLAIVKGIVLFLSSLGFLVGIFTLAIPSFTFITIQSLAWFTGGTIAVTAACVVATGLPCAAAIAIYAAITAVSTYFTASTSYTWISTLIFTPLSIILIIFISKLARGQ